MTAQQKYLLALGGFRRAVHDLMGAAAGLQAAAHELDPKCEAPDDPVAAAIFGECLEEMRGMGNLLPGVRQLLRAAVEV